MIKTGIMGGTFDPVHNGHLRLAECAGRQYSLSQIWFMPSKIPPHKVLKDISPEYDRLQMLYLAIEDISGFSVSDFELQRQETTYTAHTMRLLKEAYPDRDFYFIMGADSFFQFDTWHHPEEIIRYAKILASGREGIPERTMRQRREELLKKYRGEFYLLDMEEYPVSSSRIRNLVRQGKPVEMFVPQKVAEYIRQTNLYKE